MMEPQRLDPTTLAPAVGFSHGIARRGLLVALAGQNGHNAGGQLVGPDLVTQMEQALRNLLAVVAAAGGGPEDIVKLTIYVRDVAAYRAARPALGTVWRSLFGRYYPAMTLLQVADFFDPGAVVEIDGLAVVPEAGPPGR